MDSTQPRAPHPRPARAWLHAATLVLVQVVASCGDPANGAASAGGVDPDGASRDVQDLIEAVTPLPATVAAGEQHDWFVRRRRTLERLRDATPEHGRIALERFRESADAPLEIRQALLEVAAHNAPREAQDLLVELVTEFGPHLGLRTTAAVLLGETAPARALAVLEPILRGERSGRTYPPEDRLLQAWNEAALAEGVDRVPLLCLVATDMKRDYDVRSRATKLLGELPGTQGRQALEQLLVESSGNHLIRRYAAQSLRTTLPADELCALLRRTLDREADIAFQEFLDHMMLANCR